MANLVKRSATHEEATDNAVIAPNDQKLKTKVIAQPLNPSKRHLKLIYMLGRTTCADLRK